MGGIIVTTRQQNVMRILVQQNVMRILVEHIHNQLTYVNDCEVEDILSDLRYIKETLEDCSMEDFLGEIEYLISIVSSKDYECMEDIL